MPKVFIDTNFLIYSMDEFNPKKREKCRFLLKSAVRDLQSVILTQIMQEFYVAATKKLGVDPLLVKDILHCFEHFEIVRVDPAIIYDAIDCGILNRISFRDALIVVAMESARCEKIWTEDLNDGRIIRGVRIENPLKPTAS